MRSLITRICNSRNSLAVLVLLLSALSLSRAQDYASITGTATDPSGAVIRGANVTLSNDSTGASYKATTNSLGAYTFTNVAPGPAYRIMVTAGGFKSAVVTGIYLSVSTTRTQNVMLVVGGEQQTVEVSASAENVTLNTTDASVGNSFQVQEMNELPVQNRDSPAALFYQQPGVTLGGSVTGARSDQSNVTVDGLEVNDNATGGFGDIVGNAPVDSVQEFRGVTGDPLASAGQGGGGQFELVTKSGTNHFHGDANEYHRDTDIEANDWFNNNSGTPRPPLVRNQFGGNIGGPIWRNKAFFFFDYDGRRDARSYLVDRTVPIGTSQDPGYAQGLVSYVNTSGNTVTLSPSQVAALDPAGIGWNQTLLQLFQKRFPTANDLTGDVGDLVNTAGFRFNAPRPYTENDYVGKVDYTINDKMKISGKGSVVRTTATENPIQFPGDPLTYPFKDGSYQWVVQHTWTINNNMLNEASYGEVFEDYNFDVAYNPQGIYQYGYSGLSGPYGGGNNSQARTYPVPVFRDDFSWQKGKHSFTFGGTFKWKTPDEFAAEDYYFPGVGVTGNTGFTALTPSLRPTDINSNATSIWDSAFSTALGAYADTGANFNFNNKGTVLPQGTGLSLVYRDYESEIYFVDTWKLTPNLEFTYGLRYENYSVPYETHGNEAITDLVDSAGNTSTFTWDKFWKDRVAQSAAGQEGNDVLPFLQFLYGGKVNNKPSYFNRQNLNFAPRVALAYSPAGDKKSVFTVGGSLVYDYSIINALQFQQLQTSYVFEGSNTAFYGTAANLGNTDPASGGLPRFSGISSPPPLPAAPAITTPYIPYVQDGAPVGLPDAAFNLMMDTNLKTPYNIQLTAGMQHEFPQGFLLKVNYFGRLGRRLLAEADSSELLDFPDNSGLSSQTMGQAFAGLVTQLRQNAGLGPLGAILAVTPQPWFEDVFPADVGVDNGFASTTQLLAYYGYPYPQRGDFADAMYLMSYYGLLPTNVGMASQFSSNTVWTNKGSSNYHSMLVTLHKNASFGLRFDLNYTWSHSIDNVSAVANYIASNSGVGFICDVQRPRECRGNSDFDLTNQLNGNVIYELPFGRGKSIGAGMPFWLNEAVGGWEISSIPEWHTGYPYSANSNAFVTGFATLAPATLIGPSGAAKVKIHGGEGQRLNAFQNPAAALAAFTGPTGFNVGQRNILRGPGFFNVDLGLGKTFPIYEDKVNLKFRCDAFNAFNHPNFGLPNVDITQSSGIPFGTIGATVGSPGSDLASRVLQGSLRLEF